MRSKLLICAVMLLLAGCTFNPPDDAMSVKEVREQIHSLDGKSVAVIGWIDECYGLNCGLYESLDDARLVSEGSRQTDAWHAAMDRRLSIGLVDRIDFQAQFFQFKQVVIYGRVNSHCRQEGVFCFDRADDIQPTSIQMLL